MSSCLLVLGLVLAGQVSSANDRYPVSGNTRQGDAANGASENTTGSGLVPIIPTTADQSRGLRGAVPPSGSASDPNATSTAPLGSAIQRSSPFSGATTLPVAGATPQVDGVSSPFGEYQTQPNPPASSSVPVDPTTGLKPSAMMRAMLTPPRESRLAGERVALTDAVAGAASRADQTQRVEAYWDLCSSVADYYLGLREQEELRRLRTLVPRVGPTWQQAESELTVRVGTSQRAAFASQHRLAAIMGRGGSLIALPLPADIPHCGDYHSHYEEIFAGRPSVEAQELAGLLPLRYTELRDAAIAVTRAENWLDATARNDNSDGTGKLRALELLALRRRAFVQIARDYNRRIVRYADLATPGQVGADRLVGMLIKRDAPSTATRSAAPAAAPNNRQSNNARDAPASTFAEGLAPAGGDRQATATRDEAVSPASGATQQTPRTERSLLVPSR